jgi:coenzyme Q-binding protein COQ10
MPGAKHTTLFDVPLDALWEVITDYESYPEFVADMVSLGDVKRDGNVVTATYVISLMGTKVKYTLKHTETPKKKLVWEMVEGEKFKTNNGGWELKPKGDNQVEATYTVDVSFPIYIPVPKAVVDGMTKTQLPTMMKAFEDRAKKMMKAGGAKKAAVSPKASKEAEPKASKEAEPKASKKSEKGKK